MEQSFQSGEMRKDREKKPHILHAHTPGLVGAQKHGVAGEEALLVLVAVKVDQLSADCHCLCKTVQAVVGKLQHRNELRKFGTRDHLLYRLLHIYPTVDK